METSRASHACAVRTVAEDASARPPAGVAEAVAYILHSEILSSWVLYQRVIRPRDAPDSIFVQLPLVDRLREVRALCAADRDWRERLVCLGR